MTSCRALPLALAPLLAALVVGVQLLGPASALAVTAEEGPATKRACPEDVWFYFDECIAQHEDYGGGWQLADELAKAEARAQYELSWLQLEELAMAEVRAAKEQSDMQAQALARKKAEIALIKYAEEKQIERDRKGASSREANKARWARRECRRIRGEFREGKSRHTRFELRALEREWEAKDCDNRLPEPGLWSVL